MPLFRRSIESAETSRPPFGEWLVTKFAGDRPLSEMTPAEIEGVCANAGSVTCAAAYARPKERLEGLALTGDLVDEAGVVARRTGDAFKAMLDDPKHAVIAWPWDHLATRIVSAATREGAAPSAAELGRALDETGTAYGIAYREQMDAVLDFWKRVTDSMETQGKPRPQDLEVLAVRMLDGFGVAFQQAAG